MKSRPLVFSAAALLGAAVLASALPAVAQFRASAVSAGSYTTCAITTSGVLNCWGFNSSGELGTGSRTGAVSSPQRVLGFEAGAKSVAATSRQSACGVTKAGALKCWGRAEFGLGDGKHTLSFTPVAVVGLESGVESVVVGYEHVCALTSAGAVTCFGRNRFGQLGDNNGGRDAYIPSGLHVVGLQSGVKAIGGGTWHACALTIDGSVKCWGKNEFGQLGDSTDVNRPAPVSVPGLERSVVQLSTNGNHTCALLTNASLRCWGANHDRQVDNTPATGILAPVPGPLPDPVSIVAAGYDHTCAALVAGGVKCWGSNRYGQLGNSSIGGWHGLPQAVRGITGKVTRLTAGQGFTCAQVEGDVLKCWGDNQWGTIGDGATVTMSDQSQLLPTPVLKASFSQSREGLWWRSPAGSENGWGVNLAHQGNTLFGTWFTYDAQKKGMWVVMPNGVRQEPADRYVGDLYRTSGPQFDALPWDPSAVRLAKVGTATFSFDGENKGQFDYVLDGVPGTKSIERQVFSTLPQCDLGGERFNENYQGLWWSPGGAESGWGLNVTHQGSTLFVTWFTYDALGQPQWLVASQGQRAGPGTYSGKLYRTSGPPFSSVAWDSFQLVAAEVGEVTLTFSGPDAGQFRYTLDGVTQTKAIERQLFATPLTACN